jgi:rhodanese-related sulfurtransferase
MTASWLAQMGWETYVLDGGFAGPLETGWSRPTRPALPKAWTLSPQALGRLIDADEVVVLDFAPSPVHRRGHIPGARFAIRAQLAEALAQLPRKTDIVLTSPDGAVARLAAVDVQALTGRAPPVLDGGTDSWVGAGFSLETGLEQPLNPPGDVYRRPYEGSDHAHEAMQAYLDWEFGLVAQLERDATHGFFVI